METLPTVLNWELTEYPEKFQGQFMNRFGLVWTGVDRSGQVETCLNLSEPV